MPTTVAEAFDIPPSKLYQRGAINARLDDDSPYYIDPRLLHRATTEEMRKASQDVIAHFDKVVKLLAQSEDREDTFWEAAKRELEFREVQEIALGYGSGSTAGSGIGDELSNQVIHTVADFVDAGVENPHIFEFLVVVEEGVGADRMSDMLANIIFPRLLDFSERIFDDLGIQGEAYHLEDRFIEDGGPYSLPYNPLTSSPIVLVPREILKDLPTWTTGSEFQDVYSHNEELRYYFNSLLRNKLDVPVPRAPKSTLRSLLLQHPELADEAVSAFQETATQAYDFERDPQNVQRHFDLALEFTRRNPLSLALPAEPSPEDLHNAVLEICYSFKKSIEDKGMYELLYDKDGEVRQERIIQKLFQYGADIYCRENDIDISPEVNAGRGAVDFKFSVGYHRKTVVELKRTSHPKLIHGYETQIREYEAAEEAPYSVYLVVDYQGRHDRIQDLRLMEQSAGEDGDAPELIVVDAREKAPASKFEPDSDKPTTAGPRAFFAMKRLAPEVPPPRPPM